MNFDRAAALYVYACDYHGGQSSRLYRTLSVIGSRYGLRLNDSAFSDIRMGGRWRQVGPKRYRRIEGEWPEAHAMYQRFVANKVGQ